MRPTLDNPAQPAASDHEFDHRFWKQRAEKYNQLDWANRSGYLESFLAAAELAPTDITLDVGTGTGIIAGQIAPLVRTVTGVDASAEMLAHARETYNAPNIRFQQADVRSLPFETGSFDKVTARMVFHHVLEGAETGIQEIFRILRPGGIFVFSEGIPPTPDLRAWYTEMFALKEERRTFLESDISQLIGSAAFSRIESSLYLSQQVSVRNWLENGAVPEENRRKIWQMHLDLSDDGKRAYKMTVTPDDILIDMKFVIARAFR